MFQYYRSFNGYVIGVQVRKQLGKKFIYQVVNGEQRRKRYVVPWDPKTILQLIQRWKMSQAVLSWQSLSSNDQEYYRKREPFVPTMSGYNYYLSEYMKKI